MNRYLIGLSAIILILIAGCIEAPEVPGLNGDGTGPTGPTGVKECRTVYVEEPYTEEVCNEVTYSEPECIEKELDYTAGTIQKTDLCVADGECTGKSLYVDQCLYFCSGAMKRCQMDITNNDEKLAGTWVLGATFAYSGASFVKNPQTATIEPGATHTFDFEQMYQLDSLNIATCSLYVLHPVTAKDCVNVERKRTDCTNVTKTRIVSQEICD